MKKISKAFIFGCFLLLNNSLFAQSKIIRTDPTGNKDKVQWEWQLNMGSIPQNEPAIGTFKVKNVSNDTLIIRSVEAGCKCTITEFSKNPILPQQEGFIKAKYDAKKVGDFYKVIAVTTNFDPTNLVTLGLQGTVVAK